MASIALKDFPAGADLREQFFHIWRNWGSWAVRFPEKRKALAQLSVSEEITPETRRTGHKIMAVMGELLERVHGAGAVRKVPMSFVVALMNSVADATMDQMIQDPAIQRYAAKTAWRLCGGC